MSKNTAPHIQIANHHLSDSVMIVAEIGNNHEGDIVLARDMIAAAAAAGANAVKFQTIEPALLVAHDQTERIEQLNRFKLSQGAFESLAEAASDEGVLFLSTPFYIDAVNWLAPLVCAFKIASGDCNYTRLLEKVAETGKPIFLSTGATDLDEVREAQKTISEVHRNKALDPGLVLLHCVVSYPTAENDANLSALTDLSKLGTTIGYSDHTIGTDAAVLSVALGARVIEKHFTLDKNFSKFRDHALSADPDDMLELVRRVRQAEVIIGSRGKQVLQCESEAQSAVRRSVHSARGLDADTILTLDDTVCLRPDIGIQATNEKHLTGRRLNRSIPVGTPIRENDLN